MITVPFQIGASNGANEIWPLVGGQPTIPDYSSVLVWDSGTLSYTTYISDSSSGCLWDDSGYTALAGAPVLPVGQGFFLVPSSDTTNTFAGAVAVNVGTSNVMTLANGGTYLVASVVPYSGAITNGSLTTGAGGPCLFSLDGVTGIPDYSSLLIWDPGTLSYTTYISDSTSPSYWDDSGYTALLVPPSINVGQGFFIVPSATFNWTVGL